MEEKKKKIIGFQIEDDLNNALEELSLEYGVSISGVIRMIILDYLRRYKDFNLKDRKEKN